MRVGIEIANEGLRPRASALAGMARSAERLGYATAWVRAGGAPCAATDALWVAAGAADGIRLGVSTDAARLEDLVEQLMAGPPAHRRRLTVAARADAFVRSSAAARRLAGVAGILVCSVVDDAPSLPVPIQGFFATSGDAEFDAARRAQAVPAALGHVMAGDVMELVVRVPVATDAASAAVADELLSLRASGVDEVVLAAEAASSVDAAMAAYATLAETLETAGGARRVTG